MYYYDVIKESQKERLRKSLVSTMYSEILLTPSSLDATVLEDTGSTTHGRDGEFEFLCYLSLSFPCSQGMHDLDPLINSFDFLRSEDIFEESIDIITVTLDLCYNVFTKCGLVRHRIILMYYYDDIQREKKVK